MYQRVKQLGLQSVAYGLGTVSNQLAGLLLIPIYSRYLTPHEYGVVQLLGTTSAIGLAIAQLGLGNAIVKSALYDRDCDSRTLYSTAFFSLCGSALLMFTMGWTLSIPLSQLLFDTPEYARLVGLLFSGAALDTAFHVLVTARLRIEGRAVRYSILSFSAFVTRVLLSILFIVVWGRGMAGLVEAGAVQSLLLSFVYLWHLKDQIALRFSSLEWRNLLAFGLPIVPGLVASSLLAMSDRYFLRFYASVDDVGVYALGYKIASCISLVNTAFLAAWRPSMFSWAKDPDGPKVFSRVLTYYLVFGGWLGLGISILAQDILKLLSTDAYYGAASVVPLLALSYVLYGVYYVANIGPLLERKTYYASLMIGISMLVQIGLNFALIPPLGMMGAALATVLSYLCLAALSIIISHKFYPIRYELGRIVVVGSTAIGIYLASQLIHLENVYLSFALKGLLALSFPLVLRLIGFYQFDERRKIRELVGTAWGYVQQRA